MTLTVTLEAHGRFFVTDDPDGTIATALSVAVASHNIASVERELARDGQGLQTQGFGGIYRIEAREDLPLPYDLDASLDPEAEELWALYQEPSGDFVMRGDELRELVRQAIALRSRDP